MKGFKKFLLRGNVVDLAVGIIIGAAFNSVVQAIVQGLFTPFIGLLGGVPDLSALKFTIGHSEFLIGSVLNTIVSFLINAAVIYFAIIIPMNKLVDKNKNQKPTDPTDKKCPECISTIPIKATRCAFCGIKLS